MSLMLYVHFPRFSPILRFLIWGKTFLYYFPRSLSSAICCRVTKPSGKAGTNPRELWAIKKYSSITWLTLSPSKTEHRTNSQACENTTCVMWGTQSRWLHVTVTKSSPVALTWCQKWKATGAVYYVGNKSTNTFPFLHLELSVSTSPKWSHFVRNTGKWILKISRNKTRKTHAPGVTWEPTMSSTRSLESRTRKTPAERQTLSNPLHFSQLFSRTKTGCEGDALVQGSRCLWPQEGTGTSVTQPSPWNPCRHPALSPDARETRPYKRHTRGKVRFSAGNQPFKNWLTMLVGKSVIGLTGSIAQDLSLKQTPPQSRLGGEKKKKAEERWQFP